MDNGGATIGGVPYKDLGLLLLRSRIPLLPDTRQIEEELPGVDGAVDVETKYGPRLIEHEVMFLAPEEGAYQANLAKLARALNPRKGLQPLVEDRQSGKRWLVKYNGSIPIEKIATIGQFTIPFKAFYPFSESVLEAGPVQLGQGYTLGMGLQLGMDDYTYEVAGSPTVFNVYHAGTHEAYPVIRITGTGSNISITNETTEESMLYSGTLNEGETLEIDCAPLRKRITKNGVNAFGEFSGVHPKLVEGNNQFSIEATSPNLTVAFIFRHTYLY